MKKFCHPEIDKWLAQAGIEAEYYLSSAGICFISAYQFQSESVHSGLLQAVKYRLSNPTLHPIFLLSFQSRQTLEQEDTYSILCLTGTEYVRLPVMKETLYGLIKKYETALSLPKAEWESFAIPTYHGLLKTIIGKIKHDLNGIANRNALGNTVINSLRAACETAKSYPAGLPVVSKNLNNLREYLEGGEMADFMSLASKAPTERDSFLSKVVNFSEQLKNLSNSECNSVEDAKRLIFLIDKLDAEQTLKQLYAY